MRCAFISSVLILLNVSISSLWLQTLPPPPPWFSGRYSALFIYQRAKGSAQASSGLSLLMTNFSSSCWGNGPVSESL